MTVKQESELLRQIVELREYIVLLEEELEDERAESAMWQSFLDEEFIEREWEKVLFENEKLKDEIDFAWKTANQEEEALF